MFKKLGRCCAVSALFLISSNYGYGDQGINEDQYNKNYGSCNCESLDENGASDLSITIVRFSETGCSLVAYIDGRLSPPAHFADYPLCSTPCNVDAIAKFFEKETGEKLGDNEKIFDSCNFVPAPQQSATSYSPSPSPSPGV